MKLPRLTAHLVHRTWLPANGVYRTQVSSIQSTGLTPAAGCVCDMDVNGNCVADYTRDECPSRTTPECAKVYPNSPFGKPYCKCACVKYM